MLEGYKPHPHETIERKQDVGTEWLPDGKHHQKSGLSQTKMCHLKIVHLENKFLIHEYGILHFWQFSGSN